MALEPPKTDPRVARTRAAVLSAGEQLLIEHGVRGITVDAVAARTGIAKTTIYRHWPTKADLVLDIVAQQAFEFPSPNTGDALEDVRICLRAQAAAMAEPARLITLLGNLELAARDQEVARAHGPFHRARVAPLIAVLRRGVASGQLAADLDVRQSVDLLAGAVLMRAFFSDEQITEAEIDQLVDRVLSSTKSL